MPDRFDRPPVLYILKPRPRKVHFPKISPGEVRFRKISPGKVCVPKMSPGKVCLQKISPGKVCSPKISPGKVCFPKINPRKVDPWKGYLLKLSLPDLNSFAGLFEYLRVFIFAPEGEKDGIALERPSQAGLQGCFPPLDMGDLFDEILEGRIVIGGELGG
uniref:Uncharacterized protein n=1 Tax=Candidatus Kentrum sp. TUN TaxID=2126343 RepID=A0A451A883_9GAMM|nr:MAG: hypothetical protein BECKTUN1418D_GA0071000_11704 [Candidatus Kentron sp. TUN]